jgi:hypothetical protein
LAAAGESQILAALHGQGDAATARSGFTGAVLLYRRESQGALTLEGAVLRGKVVGEKLTPRVKPPRN